MLFQEYLYKEPFWMLVACCLVNQTTWTQAKPAFWAIKERWPTVEKLSKADPGELYPILQPLGLGKIRSDRLPRMAKQYIADPPSTCRDVLRLHGCGKYASDSWAIFIDKRTDVLPTDKELIKYLIR